MRSTKTGSRALLLVVLGLLALLATGCHGNEAGKQAGAAGEVLRLASFGGSFQETLDRVTIQPIAARLGVKATVEAYGGEYDRLAATIRNGTNTYDLVHVETRFLVQGSREGLLAPIDWSVVDRDAFVPGATDDHGVGLLSWALVLAWNGDRLPKGAAPPSGWKDFFDLETYPGPRALRDNPEGILELALMADGVPPREVYEGGLDVERALRKLGEIRKSITWWSSGAELEQKLTSSAVMAAAWNGRAAHLRRAAGLPVSWTYDGAVLQFDWWVVPANAPHKDLAMRFLAETANGTGQREIAEEFGYGPVSRKAVEELPEALRNELPSAPANAERGVAFDGEWWADHASEVTTRWNEWRLGK